MTTLTNAEMEQFLEEQFEANYERLRAEGAGSLAADAKLAAKQQVLLYWRRLRDVAESITETEVRLSLPSQKTPAGREYCIQGVVDIVHDGDRTIMYDIKTHDANYVRANTDIYAGQLHVYAHIWQTLQHRPLDATQVIATRPPRALQQALAVDDAAAVERYLARWDPLIPIPFDANKVEETLAEFGALVDQIESGAFAPRPVEDLSLREPGSEHLFVTRVCAECDARFSCASYREYAATGRTRAELDFATLYPSRSDEDMEAWRTAALDVAASGEELLREL